MGTSYTIYCSKKVTEFSQYLERHSSGTCFTVLTQMKLLGQAPECAFFKNAYSYTGKVLSIYFD